MLAVSVLLFPCQINQNIVWLFIELFCCRQNSMQPLSARRSPSQQPESPNQGTFIQQSMPAGTFVTREPSGTFIEHDSSPNTADLATPIPTGTLVIRDDGNAYINADS